MSKKDFSSTLGASLNGRRRAETITEVPVERPAPADPVKETKAATPKKQSKTETKKSNAGRKKIADEDKRRNFSLSLDPRTIQRIEEHVADSGRVRKATYYVSQYLEEHLDDIIDKI